MHGHVSSYGSAGYSAWFVVDASIDLSADDSQCSPELAQTGTVRRAQDVLSVWSLDFSAPGSLDSSTTKTLHINSHGGFTVLADVTYDAVAADQTLFSAVHTATRFSIVASFDGSTKAYQFDISKPYNSATSLSSAAVAAGRHVVAFRFQSYTNMMKIDSVASDGTLTNLAMVPTPLLTTVFLTSISYTILNCFCMLSPPYNAASWLWVTCRMLCVCGVCTYLSDFCTTVYNTKHRYEETMDSLLPVHGSFREFSTAFHTVVRAL